MYQNSLLLGPVWTNLTKYLDFGHVMTLELLNREFQGHIKRIWEPEVIKYMKKEIRKIKTVGNEMSERLNLKEQVNFIDQLRKLMNKNIKYGVKYDEGRSCCKKLGSKYLQKYDI